MRISRGLWAEPVMAANASPHGAAAGRRSCWPPCCSGGRARRAELGFRALAKRFDARERLLPRNRGPDRVLRSFSMGRAVVLGAARSVLGLAGLAAATWIWSSKDFGDLDHRETMRLVVPAAAMVTIGVQIALAGFVSGMFRIAQRP